MEYNVLYYGQIFNKEAPVRQGPDQVLALALTLERMKPLTAEPS